MAVRRREILAREEAEELCKELLRVPLVAVDSEAYAIDMDRTPVDNGVSLCWTFAWRPCGLEEDMEVVYLHNYGDSSGNVFALGEWWTSGEHAKLAHNAVFDSHILANHGIVGQAFDFDTMVMDYILDERREGKHGLKQCVRDHLGVHRNSFNETFGIPKIKKDGTPYASGGFIVPKLDEYLAVAEAEKLEGDSSKWENLVSYATEDAEDALLLMEFFKPQLEALPWGKDRNYWDYYLTVERPITNLIQRMERRGMYLDMPFLLQQQERITKDMGGLAASITEWAGCPLNVGSGPQLAALIYGTAAKEIKKSPTSKKVLYTIHGKGFPVLSKTDGGAPSTSADDLKELLRVAQTEISSADMDVEDGIKGLQLVVDFNALKTQKGTYFDGCAEKQVKGRLHPRINQVGSTSGRWAMANPNLMNVTSSAKDKYGLRYCFAAPRGWTLLVSDFSQLEYRLLAHLSQDPTLIKLFIEGWDMHSMTTYNVFPAVKAAVDKEFGAFVTEAGEFVASNFKKERNQGKIVNFEVIYGVGAKKLAEQLDISKGAAQEMLDGWFRGYPYVKAWQNRMLNQYRTKGYALTLGGRYRRADLSRLNGNVKWIRGEEERTLLNAIVQGSAKDMTAKAMLNIDADARLRELQVHQVNQVHDELIMEVPVKNAKEAMQLIRPHMEQPYSKPLRVPMPVSMHAAGTWAEAK